MPNILKKQISQLQAEGIGKLLLADIATNALQELLEYPLLRIRAEKYLSIYKTLVEAGADKNVRHRKNGKTALMIAVLDSRPDIVEGLLGLGMDVTVQDDDENSVLDQYSILIRHESTIPETTLLLEVASSDQKLKIA